ncbi:hypothetical protein NQ315_000133 [Exocentrus adspersus]|uniref:Uncharacterized protein n=1 Tax=Exocentrus adspersus TaxID=1586481 RepID=A0AAV8VR98_9CUCU|nr:hypothetical protein NQ315_000133 [Exocentrus adspersus]
MAEGTYEYECMRAELLGLDKPDHDDFLKKLASANAKREVEDEEADVHNLKNVDRTTESEKRILGGLEELNTILRRTQSRITRFKATCGSLTNLLKVKVAGRSGSDNEDTSESAEATAGSEEAAAPPPTGVEDLPRNQRKSDLSKALDADMSRLDRMIEKSEDAQYSMAHQSKQMRNFLK